MYFDHSATTPIHPDVQALINVTQSDIYGNPSSIHSQGKKALFNNRKIQEKYCKFNKYNA